MNTTTATLLERAIGLTVQAEARRQGVTHKHLQELTGINDKTFRRYFVAAERHIPLDDLAKVASALGMSTSALMEMAEDEALRIAPDEIEGATADERADLARAIERMRPTGRPSSGGRSRRSRDVG